MKETAKDVRPLYALVLAPTRELALQVKKHLVAVAKYTSIQVCDSNKREFFFLISDL